MAAIVVAAALAALCLALGARAQAANGSLVAIVHDGDGASHALSIQEDGEYRFETSLGTNVVRIENGTVRIVEADCPHGDCMHQRAISEPGQQLICLPHKLWVEIASDDYATDTELDENAVTWMDGRPNAATPSEGANDDVDGGAGIDTVSR